MATSRTNKRSSTQGDDGKLRIIDYLNAQQRTKSEWRTRHEIAEGCSLTNDRAKDLLYEMVPEGWLHVRHDPGRPDVLYYRLRRDGDVI